MKPFKYVVISSWWDYEPSVGMFHDLRAAELALKQKEKDYPHGESFLAKIVKGKPLPAQG